jgi:hypothetical protein
LYFFEIPQIGTLPKRNTMSLGQFCDLEKLGPIKSGKVLRSFKEPTPELSVRNGGPDSVLTASISCHVNGSREYGTERFIEGQAFSRSYDLAPYHPPPPFPSVSSTGGTQKERERETTCSGEREARGRARSRITPPQEAWPSINYHYSLMETKRTVGK